MIEDKNPARIGGTSIAVSLLTDELKNRSDILLRSVNSMGVRGSGLKGIYRFLTLLFEIYQHAKWCNIVTLHANLSGLHIIGPVTLLVSKISKKPMLLRTFAQENYFEIPSFRRSIINWVFKHVDLLTIQTKAQLETVLKSGFINVKWFSNYRIMPDLEDDNSYEHKCSNFIFLSRILKTKGIYELCSAVENLKGMVTVDIYGPFKDENLNAEMFKDLIHVRYKGVIDPENVISTMSGYDALLFPTYYDNEGYPGVILEAYAAGLPVICTNFKALPELVDENTGILVTPKDEKALGDAIKMLHNDTELYQRLRKGVRERRQEYSLHKWADIFLNYCREVIQSYGKPR